MIVTKVDVECLFKQGGYTIDERFEETGFVYFPASKPRTRRNPDQGRVFWHIEKHVYPDTLAGRTDKQLDATFGKCRDHLSISVSWGRTSDKQDAEIRQLLEYYVLHRRQKRGRGVLSLAGRRGLEEGEA